MDVKNILERFVRAGRALLGENLTGVYLHGSAAMGCYNPRRSDLDLLLVVERGLTDAVKLSFLKEAARLDGETPAKGMEWSIVRREVCRPFVYPTPFELHFSRMHLPLLRRDPREYVERMRGVDWDLAAHFAVIKRYGAALYGSPVDEVFDEVPKAAYLDSIWRDVKTGDMAADPVCCILNLCRTLAYCREELILSKRAGGEWGLRSLPEQWRGLVGSALRCYETDGALTAASGTADGFAAYMLSEIETYMARYGACTAGKENEG